MNFIFIRLNLSSFILSTHVPRFCYTVVDFVFIYKFSASYKVLQVMIWTFNVFEQYKMVTVPYQLISHLSGLGVAPVDQ